MLRALQGHMAPWTEMTVMTNTGPWAVGRNQKSLKAGLGAQRQLVVPSAAKYTRGPSCAV